MAEHTATPIANAENFSTGIVPPSSGKHEQSFIVLHGRGDTGKTFGRYLLQWGVPGYGNLALAFPNAKFIFPTAIKRRCAGISRVMLNQWFDIWSLEDPNEREELQYEGLKESTEVIHQILKQEISEVGASNVILWGLSQGCAASLVAMLLWEDEAFGAAIGMCGWMPLQKRMHDIIHGAEANDDNPFAEDAAVNHPSSGTKKASTISSVVEYLHHTLDLPSEKKSIPATNIPVFVGHGVQDEKVALKLGQDAVQLLRDIDIGVEWREYEQLDHWYSSEMLRDIVHFIKQKTTWTVASTAQDEQA